MNIADFVKIIMILLYFVRNSLLTDFCWNFFCRIKADIFCQSGFSLCRSVCRNISQSSALPLLLPLQSPCCARKYHIQGEESHGKEFHPISLLTNLQEKCLRYKNS